MNYSKQLKDILDASGWTQEDVAKQLGVSFVTLNSWVNAKSKPRKKALESIRLLYFDVLGADSLDVGYLEKLKEDVERLNIKISQITENEEVFDKLILYLTYHTNVIEGSTMTLDDTREVLFENRTLTNRTQVEQAEARNHKAALVWLLSALQSKSFVIDEDLIKGLHLRLMNGIIENAGVYRNHSVRVMGAHVTVANYQKIPELVQKMLTKINVKTERKEIIEKLSETHAIFEKIHPFSDGNGRVGRLLMLAQALQTGIVPPLVLKERRLAYYKYLEVAQTQDNSMPLQLFIAESVVAANELLFK
ncbi:MAG TPA: Fic family protein [Candidatus Saccharimonadales bacterium]|nr:Fic family protein [Candidatus Saccharimonadales bacterium]